MEEFSIASESEPPRKTGHEKLLDSLCQLITAVETLDAEKLTAPADLKLDAVSALHTEAVAAHKQFCESRDNWQAITLERSADSKALASLASRAVALLEARGASDATIESARKYVRKLQGKRKKPSDNAPAFDAVESEASVSSSHQSNLARISAFIEFINFLATQREYAGVTNDAIKITDLRQFAKKLKVKHNASINSAARLTSDRDDRDDVFFHSVDSVINRAKRLKKLVGAIYGFDSPQYAAVNEIHFTKTG